MLIYSLTDPISEPGPSPFPPHLDFKSRPTATLAQFLTLVFKFSLQNVAPSISPLTICSLYSTTVPINLLSPHCILLKLLYSMSTMWHSACDDLCPPLPCPPPVPPCCFFQVPRVLDPPCTYSPTLDITLPAGVSSAFLRDRPVPGHARSGLSHDDPRLLDPPCTYSPALNITLPAGAPSAFLRDHPEPGHARSGLSHDVLPPLRP